MNVEIAATMPPVERDVALTDLLQKSAPRGLRIAARLIGAADAEDAVQEALARTVADLGRVREPEAWFMRTLVNHCIGVQRRRRLWRLFAGSAEPVSPELPPTTDEQLGDARLAAALRRHVDGLPAMQRTVVQLRFGEELAIAEIAGVLGIGDETVKTHLARALARLRNEMGRQR